MIEEFATHHRLKVTKNECDEVIIAGRIQLTHCWELQSVSYSLWVSAFHSGIVP